jgi:predicted ATP-binding protein involved in virulence
LRNPPNGPLMLKRFYADNFRCLVNFEFRPPTTSVLVGRNGSGKSAVLEGLKLVSNFLFGEDDVARTESATSTTPRRIRNLSIRVRKICRTSATALSDRCGKA